ncbi:MAG: HAMP domain-containing histidine kinase [Kiritimatiellae bacterium]|nr:HAMP domain-containing histidine kinase [Kiritimatiellia bacterium]
MKLVKAGIFGFLPYLIAAASFAVLVKNLAQEIDAFRASEEAAALRELAEKTTLAAAALRPALEKSDFRAIHDFGGERRKEGVRLSIVSARGGLVFDSHSAPNENRLERPEIKDAAETGAGRAIRNSRLYTAKAAGEWIVRLSVPYKTVGEGIRKAQRNMVLAGAAGAAGLLCVFLFIAKLVARNRALAREKEQKAKLLANMEKVEEFRKTFISDITHEIKTPVTGILGVADLLEAPVQEADRATLIAMLRHEASRLDALVQDILSLAHLEHAEGMMHIANENLGNILRSAAQRKTSSASAAGVRLIVQPTPLLYAPCDARLVEQALVNLIGNALEHSGSDEVKISLAGRDGFAVFAVEDRGRGIPAKWREHLFERFWRGDDAREGGTAHTGLGLAIVRQTARLAGGDAWFEAPLRGGARFLMKIPLDGGKQKENNNGK